MIRYMPDLRCLFKALSFIALTTLLSVEIFGQEPDHHMVEVINPLYKELCIPNNSYSYNTIRSMDIDGREDEIDDDNLTKGGDPTRRDGDPDLDATKQAFPAQELLSPSLLKDHQRHPIYQADPLNTYDSCTCARKSSVHRFDTWCHHLFIHGF